MKITINQKLCSKCGECKAECPTFAVKQKNTDFYIDNTKCIKCGHCAAVCAFSAVDGVVTKKHFIPEINAKELQQFLQNKRSTRRYTEKGIPVNDLKEIAAAASSAATASNTMDWQLNMYTGPLLKKMRAMMLQKFDKHYGLVKFVLTNPLMRLISRKTALRPYVMKTGTAETFSEYVQAVRKGNDPVLFNAPALFVLSCPKNSKHYGMANCSIAGSQMMEMAASMGFGSCMVGFAEFLLNLFPKIKKTSGISKKNKIFLVFTLGYPDVKYFGNPIRDFKVFHNAEKITL